MKLKSLTKHFVKSKDGAAAAEFAIVATPFFALMFAIIEVSLIYFGNISLENGMMEAARQVRTGQLQIAGGSEADFKDTICDYAEPLLDCSGGLYVDVRTFEDFGDTDFPDPLNGGEVSTSFVFNPGVDGDVVLVRAFYVWDVKTPLMTSFLANMNDGRRLLSASAAFRNEPFGSILN